MTKEWKNSTRFHLANLNKYQAQGIDLFSREVVSWGVVGNIVWAWIFTIPAAAFLASIAYWVSWQIF